MKIEINLAETSDHISTFFIKSDFESGTISVEKIKDGEWWVSRAKVTPEKLTGQGYGTRMMDEIKKAAVRQGCKKMVVCPGGYKNDKKRQINFYVKNGFVEIKKGVLVWENK